MGGGFGMGVWVFLGFECFDGGWIWRGFQGEGEGCNGGDEMEMEMEMEMIGKMKRLRD